MCTFYLYFGIMFRFFDEKLRRYFSVCLVTMRINVTLCKKMSHYVTDI